MDKLTGEVLSQPLRGGNMYKSKLLHYPEYDLRWFWDEVAKFNGIANPDGVNKENQIAIIKSELQEILDSTNETKFMDGIIDGLVTLAPLVNRGEFLIYYDEDLPAFSTGFNYHYLESGLERYLRDLYLNEFDHESMVEDLLQVLICDETHYEQNVQSVVDSNLSKFIPIEEYNDNYLEEVKKSYPDVDVIVESRYCDDEEFKVFFNKNTGKILKGHSYFKEPELICE